MMELVNIVASIVSGIAVCIPLVIKLVEYIRKSIQEKQWTVLMQLVLKLMSEAERNFDNGVARKEYVMASIEALKDSLGCEVDMSAVSAMIDSICDASKIINAATKAEDE